MSVYLKSVLRVGELVCERGLLIALCVRLKAERRDMLKEEKAKKKEKARNPLLWLAYTLILCIGCYGIYVGLIPIIYTSPFSSIWWINGIRYSNEMEARLLERIPLGSTENEVEAFIMKNLQPFERCENSEAICIRFRITRFNCVRAEWWIHFIFDEGLLSEINAYLPSDSCID
jgi:hypothetical protein